MDQIKTIVVVELHNHNVLEEKIRYENQFFFVNPLPPTVVPQALAMKLPLK